MEPWQRANRKVYFEIKGNLGPVFRIIRMDRVELGDSQTRESNRLVTRGNTLHRRLPYSNTMSMEKRLLGAPTVLHDEQRRVRRVVHELRNSLVEVTWPDEFWKKLDKRIKVVQRARGAMNNPSYTETKQYRWRMNIDLVLTRYLIATKEV